MFLSVVGSTPARGDRGDAETTRRGESQDAREEHASAADGRQEPQRASAGAHREESRSCTSASCCLLQLHNALLQDMQAVICLQIIRVKKVQEKAKMIRSEEPNSAVMVQ